MPLRAAQLFFRCRSLEELGETLGRALRKKGQPAEALTLLGLQTEGWGTVVIREPDGALAKLFSERFGTALSLHLDGSRLALSVQTWQSGEPGEEERDPQPPHFRDVEAAAWELLAFLGVPPSLRLLQLEQVDLLDSTSPSAVQAVLARSGPEGFELRTVPVAPPARDEGPSPPVAPDVVVESKAGEARALEVRTLPGGIPLDSWAEALASIEEAQALRLLHALADGDEARMPRPAFAYRSQQALRVEKLLARARRDRPWLWRLLDPDRPAPLTRAGLTDFCRGKLPGVARAHGRYLEVEGGLQASRFGLRAVVRAPVTKVYQVYLSTLDEDAAAAQLVQETCALVERPAQALLPEHLLPTLFVGDPGGRAVRPLGPDRYAALLSDDGTRIAPVLSTELAALGLAEGAAFERALQRMDALTEQAPEGIRWFDLEHGRVVLCDFADAGGAGRLLSRRARELLLDVLGEDEALAAAPTRDALLACADLDDEGAAWLQEEARRRFEEGPFPLHAGLWRIGKEFLHPVAEVGAGSSPRRS